MQILDRRNPLFRFHVFGNEFHRPWPVKRDECDDVVELLYVELLRQTRHPTRLHLEKTDRFAAVIESKRSGIIEWNILQRKVWLALVNQGSVSSMTVSVFNPRKSIFRRPRSLSGPMAYWLITSLPFTSRQSGM